MAGTDDQLAEDEWVSQIETSKHTKMLPKIFQRRLTRRKWGQPKVALIFSQLAAILILGCQGGCSSIVHNALFPNPNWTNIAPDMAANQLAAEVTMPVAQGPRQDICVPTKINGQLAWLNLDTGSPILVLWSDRAARFGLEKPSIFNYSDISANGNSAGTVHLTVWGRETNVDALISTAKDEDWPMDGILPLSYFRKDVVQIDAANHEAHLLKEVPAEAQSWAKFPLRNDLPELAFSMPISDGKQALIYVDTGSPYGVFIPAKRWQAWHDENPQAQITWTQFSQPATGREVVEKESWAKHFALGNLQLADVPITEMPDWAGEGSSPGPFQGLAAMLVFQTNVYSLMPARDATLGMAALKQLDMIVDGPGGFIYIKSKDTTPSSYDHNRLGAIFVTSDLLNSSADEPPRAKVAPGSPAEEAGIRDGDILLELDGYQGSYTGVAAIDGINSMFAEPAGTKIGMKVKRGDQTFAINAILRNILGPDQSTAYSYITRGLTELTQGDYSAAIADDNQALELDPKNALAYFSRGRVEQIKGDNNSAIADYTTAIDGDPQNFDFYFVRGDAEQAKHDYDGAIADKTKAIELDPQNATAYETRGYARWHKNDIDGAIADETEAIEIDPKDSSAYEYRGYARLARGDRDGAIADETKAIELDPQDAFAYEFRGIVEQIQGNFASALVDYNKAIEVEPDDTYYSRLYLQFLLLRSGTASVDFATTVTTWKDGWTKSLGLFVAGKLDEAGLLAEAEKKDVEPVDEQKCEAYYDIGMMRLLKGDQAGARDSFQKSMDTGTKVYDEYNLAQAELARIGNGVK